MAIQKFKVTYQDGSERTTLVTPLATFLAEEKYGGFLGNRESAVRIMHFLAWRSLHQAGQEPAKFEAWLEKIVDVEDVTPPDSIRDLIAGILLRVELQDTDEAEQILNLADQLDEAGGVPSPPP